MIYIRNNDPIFDNAEGLDVDSDVDSDGDFEDREETYPYCKISRLVGLEAPWGAGVWWGLTSGVFDILHLYHLRYLERCSAECGSLIVGVDSDRLVEELKGRKPVINEADRAYMVHALECVTHVFINDNLESDFGNVTAHADVVFKNNSMLYGREIIGGAGKLHLIPDVFHGYSSTDIKTAIVSGTTMDEHRRARWRQFSPHLELP